MGKLTIEELKNKYKDNHIAVLPVNINESPVKVHRLENSSHSAQMDSAPIVAFMLCSGIAMYAGLMILVTGGTAGVTQSPKTKVLGESVVQDTEEDQEVEINVLNAVTDSIDDLNQKRYEEDLKKQEQLKEESRQEIIEEEVIEEIVFVKIDEIPGGWVNYREVPNGRRAVGRVASGTEYELISEEDDWFEIKISEDEIGWVSAGLVEKL